MNTYLHNKEYRILTNANLLNAVGNSLFNIVFIVYASTLPFNTLAVSLASITIFIPSLFQPLVGHQADQTKEKLKWNIYSRLIQFLLFSLLAVLILLEPSFLLFSVLLLINVVADCLGFFSSTLQLSFIKELVDEESLRDVMGFQNAMFTLIQLIFQGLGAFLIVQLNYNFSVFAGINAITFLLAALVIMASYSLLKPCNDSLKINENTVSKSNSFIEDFKEVTTIFMKNPFLKMIISFAVLINLLTSTSESLLNISLLTKEYLWIGNLPNSIALIGIFISVGLLIGSLWTKDFLRNVSSSSIISLILTNITLIPILLILVKSFALVLISLFTLGYLIGKLNPRVSAFMISEVPQEKLGITSGVFSTLVMAGAPIGQLIFLGTANIFNDTLSWWLYGGIALVFLSLSLISKKQEKVVTETL